MEAVVYLVVVALIAVLGIGLGIMLAPLIGRLSGPADEDEAEEGDPTAADEAAAEPKEPRD